MARRLPHVLAALAVAFPTFAPAGAAEGPPCGPRAELRERLERLWRETTAAAGIAAGGGLVELLLGPGGATWTIMVTGPGGATCVLAYGRDWRGFARPEGPDL